MATYRWTGAVSTSWATAGNWDPTSGPPTTTDDVVLIPRTAHNHLLTGLDRTGDNAGAGLNLSLLRVDRGSTVQIGSLDAPLRVTADDLIFKGAAPFYFDCEMGGANSTPTIRALIQADNPNVPVMLLGTNAIQYLFILRGNVTYINSGANQFAVLGYTNFMTDATLTVPVTTAALATLVIAGGTLHSYDAQSTVFLGKGEFIQEAGAVVFLHQGGGRFTCNSTSTLGIVYALNGTTDFTQTGDVKALTTAYVWPNTEFLYAEDLLTGTINFVDQLL